LNDYNNSFFDQIFLQIKERQNRKTLFLHIQLKGYGYWITPIPPLNFSVMNHDNEKIVTFKDHFRKLFQGEKFDSALKYIQKISEKRNQVLYASERGHPKVEGDLSPFLKEQKKKVFTIISLVLLIEPWIDEGHSAFVQQAVDGFLLLLDKIEESDIFSPHRPQFFKK
jgi:hypothetical protein